MSRRTDPTPAKDTTMTSRPDHANGICQCTPRDQVNAEQHPYPEHLPPALDRVWVAVDQDGVAFGATTTADVAIIAAQAETTTNQVAHVRDGQIVPLTPDELDALRWELGRIKWRQGFGA